MIAPGPTPFVVSDKPWSVSTREAVSTDVTAMTPFVARQSLYLKKGLQALNQLRKRGLGLTFTGFTPSAITPDAAAATSLLSAGKTAGGTVVAQYQTPQGQVTTVGGAPVNVPFQSSPSSISFIGMTPPNVPSVSNPSSIAPVQLSIPTQLPSISDLAKSLVGSVPGPNVNQNGGGTQTPVNTPGNINTGAVGSGVPDIQDNLAGAIPPVNMPVSTGGGGGDFLSGIGDMLSTPVFGFPLWMVGGAGVLAFMALKGGGKHTRHSRFSSSE